MLCREIIDVIEGTYPKEAALAWDNVGLLVGRTEKEVKRIYVALDATDEIVEAAIRGNACHASSTYFFAVENGYG